MELYIHTRRCEKETGIYNTLRLPPLYAPYANSAPARPRRHGEGLRGRGRFQDGGHFVHMPPLRDGDGKHPGE